MKIKDYLQLKGKIKFMGEKRVLKNAMQFINDSVNIGQCVSISILSGKIEIDETLRKYILNDYHMSIKPLYSYSNNLQEYYTLVNFLYDLDEIEYISIRLNFIRNNIYYYNVIVMTKIHID